MTPPAPPRAIIFIDGSNFYHKLKFLVDNRVPRLKLLDFNYWAFGRDLAKNHALQELRYYVGAVKRQNGFTKEKSGALYGNQQKLLGRLQQQNIPVVLGNLIQHPDKSYHKKVLMCAWRWKGFAWPEKIVTTPFTS